ncbi:MAG: hypothetical protein Q8R18_01825 [bacterium]|nr:hypothetical protein [bacterium]
MGFSDWLESTFSADKFNAQKGLKYIRREYKSAQAESGFNQIFLDLAEEEMTKQKRLLSLEEVERVTHRARIQARHRTRNINKGSANEEPFVEKSYAEESMPRTMGTLSREIYDRLDKQLQTVKTTTNPFLSEGELATVRNLKLKNAEENILKIIQELSTQTKARGISTEMERAYSLEITRWTKFAKKTNGRLEKKVSSLDFKDYVNDFERSFQSTRKESKV